MQYISGQIYLNQNITYLNLKKHRYSLYSNNIQIIINPLF